MEHIEIKRTRLSYQQKKDILELIKRGVKRDEIKKQYKVHEKTLRRISKNEAEIMKRSRSCEFQAKKTKNSTKFPILESFLVNWIHQRQALGNPISGPILQKRALEFCDTLKLNEELAASHRPKFTASNGWLHKFKLRHGIRKITAKGKILWSDFSGVEEFRTDLTEKVDNEEIVLTGGNSEIFKNTSEVLSESTESADDEIITEGIMADKLENITFGILSISDTCSQHPEQDKSGPALVNFTSNQDTRTGRILRGRVVYRKIVPDEETEIVETLLKWSDDSVNVILTTGGTGFASRDVTPEATRKVIEKETQGISLAILTSSLKVTPMAMLSRAVSGIRKKTLIINLPGSPKAVEECLDVIASVIPHSVNLILGINTKDHAIPKSIEIPHSHTCRHNNPDLSTIDVNNVAGRLRESPFPMLSMKEAEDLLKTECTRTPESETLYLQDAPGRILWRDEFSGCNLPPFRASIKDGYAVIAGEGAGKRIVLAGITAGQVPGTIKITLGTCVRVNTGSSIPDEATAVVQVEDTKLLEIYLDSNEEKEIEILVAPKEGQDIRLIGSDIQKGTLLLKKNTKLSATEIGILAACGYHKISVVKSPRVGILSTGNELQNPGEPSKPGHVYDSNKITLITLLKENGFSPKDLGTVKDDESSMVSTIQDSLQEVDLIVTTGSVSMGEKDLLKPILHKKFGATIHFGRINMKPGKPTTFATCMYQGEKKYFFCLPGNPVSATVTAHLFVLPALHRLSGHNYEPVVVKAKLAFAYTLDPRPDYVRTHLHWKDSEDLPEARSTGNQISSKLLSFVNANALLMMPGKTAEKTAMEPGDVVRAMLLGFNKKLY